MQKASVSERIYLTEREYHQHDQKWDHECKNIYSIIMHPRAGILLHSQMLYTDRINQKNARRILDGH